MPFPAGWSGRLSVNMARQRLNPGRDPRAFPKRKSRKPGDASNNVWPDGYFEIAKPGFLPNCRQLVRLQNSLSQEKRAAHFGALSVYWSLSRCSRCMREHDAMLRVLFTKPGEPATLPSSVKQL